MVAGLLILIVFGIVLWVMSNGHYNEEYALQDAAKMYYTDASGNKKYAPYWTPEQIKSVYDSVRSRIPSEYNMWDFYVALNMAKSDNCPMYRKWFPGASAEDMDEHFIDAAINWLDDDDNPYGTEKAWKYLNQPNSF